MNKYLAIILLFIISCSPQKRLERIIRNNPWLEMKDTLVVIDTILTPNITIDTVLVTKPVDTIILHNDKLKVEILRFFDTLYVNAEYESDTIYVEKQIVVDRIKTVDTSSNKFPLWIIILMCIGLGIILMWRKK